MSAKRLLLATLLFSPVFVIAQDNASVSGKIVNKQQKPLAGAVITVLNSNGAIIADAAGNFSIGKLARGVYVVHVKSLGYAEKTIELQTGGDNTIILEEQVNQLSDVVVSAEKREQFLQKIPVSVTSLSAKEVTDYRLWNAKDISGIAPNLYSGNPGDNRNVTSLRGIATTSYDPAVATYIDGVNQFSLDTYIGNLFDVERIEVLRGPQGTLYGRTAMGGVINIITKQPTNATEGFAELSFGNYGRQRYSAGIKTPIVKNKLFFGAALMYDKLDGYYTNESYNNHYDKQHATTGNYYLKWIASDNWNVSLNVKHQLARNNGPFPLVFGVEDAFASPYQVNQNAVSEMVDNVFNSALSVKYTGRAFNFTSQTAYQSNYRYYTDPLDGDFSPIDGITVINNYGKPWNNVKAWTQEFRFSSPASVSSPWQWTAGAYFFINDAPNKQATHFGKDAGYLGVPDTDFSQIVTSKANKNGAALFGQATYAINKKLELTAGIRFDYEHSKLNVLGQYQKDPNPEPIFDTRPDTTGTASFNAFSPKLNLLYHASANSNLYASYSRGYRPGGLTQLGSDPSQPPLYKFDPENSNSFEVGIKNTLFNNKLRLNIAAFFTNVVNAQVPTLVLPDAITITKNAGKLQSKGAELELATTFGKGFELSYNFGYTDAKYTSLKLPSDGEEVNFNGNKQVFTPNITSSLALQYSHRIAQKQNLQFVVRGEWFYFGKQYFDLANQIAQSPYDLFNTRVGFSSKHADLFFWMRNIGDVKYIGYAYDFGGVHLAEPQTLGVTLTAKF
ncbi:MAG TPA: TonB-dependent receptor [Panacibacter sp.]|nr:TonB-dependent receptor [Panacibacter sp.]HNP46363.1 TonB-dependent receptor [Panacibacter sp.]